VISFLVKPSAQLNTIRHLPDTDRAALCPRNCASRNPRSSSLKATDDRSFMPYLPNLLRANDGKFGSG